MLTARREERDKLAGFAHGADDYLTKPFSMKELSCAGRRRCGGACDARRRPACRRRRPIAIRGCAWIRHGAACTSRGAESRDTAGVPSALSAGIEPR